MSNKSTIEELFCALLYLLTRQSRFPDQDLSQEINEHLNWLSDHPQASEFPLLRKTSARLAMYWEPNSDMQEKNGPVRLRFGIH